MRLLACSLVLAAMVPAISAQTPGTPAPVPPPVLSPAEAAQHVGELRTVCGTVANIHTASGSHGAPTFVDMDQAWPHQIFDFVIWGDDQDTVGRFPKSGKVCASGKITVYRGRPEILLTDWHSWYVPDQQASR
jgi:hypothetical protein